MSWTVRNQFGALEFETLQELELAQRLGVVSSEDEVLDPGSHEWRRVGTHEHLARARTASARAGASPVPFGYILAAVVMAAGSLYVLAKGAWAVSLLLCVFLAAMLTAVTTRAFKIKRTA
jgi:hypothetical protein